MRVGEWVKSWAEKSNIRLEYYFEATSTNDIAKSYDYSGIDPVVFVTESQTRGRGRGANTWTNPEAGTALLSTWSFGVESAPQPIMTALLGLAVYRSLQQTLKPEGLSLKAPNDLYVGTKKVGGLLVEVVSEGSQHRLIVGIGLNVFAAPKLAIAGALKGSTEVDVTQNSFTSFLNVLFVEMAQAINDGSMEELSHSAQSELLEALNANPLVKDKYTSVEPDGSLITETKKIDWLSL